MIISIFQIPFFREIKGQRGRVVFPQDWRVPGVNRIIEDWVIFLALPAWFLGLNPRK
jgi:hypothetical protein